MGLNHDFAVGECDGEWWRTHHVYAGTVHLHDDLLRYMLDTLAWIPSFNPAKGEHQTGLCIWGPTEIRHEGAEAAGRIFRSWASLFSSGPSQLNLRGPYTWIETSDDGSTVTPTGYARLVFDRNEVCSALLAVAAMCDEVLASDGRLCLRHAGV